MALERLLHELECCSFVAIFGDEALQDLAFLIDGTPQIAHLAVHLHVHFIEVPAPLAKAPHTADTLATNVACKQWTEPVPPVAYGLVGNVDATLCQQVFDVPQ